MSGILRAQRKRRTRAVGRCRRWESTSEPGWANASFEEEDGYIWDLGQPGVSVEHLSQPST